MKEKFTVLQIDGVKTDYMISNTGKIFTKDGKRLKSKTINKYGYPSTGLVINGKLKTVLVHRAVFESFYGPIPKDLQINHIDGDKTNSNLDNLEAITPIQNVHHAWDNGLCKPQVRKGELNSNYRGGDLNPHSYHTNEEAIAVYKMLKETNLPHRVIAQKLNVETQFVKNIALGLWSDITGYKREQVTRNQEYTEEDDLIIWYLYRNGYRTKELVKLFGINKNSINNKLGYIRHHKEMEMDFKIKDPKVPKLVKKFLKENDMFSIELG
jgi:hypothetical protein